MQALSRKRKSQAQPEVVQVVDSDTATENEDKPGPLPEATSSTSTSRSSKSVTHAKNDRPQKSKRRRLADPTLEFQEELIGTLRQDMKSREEHQKTTDEQLKNFMESSKKQGEQICDILKGLVEVERSRALARQMSIEL